MTQALKNGYYRLTSERASYKSIAQFIDGLWYVIGEEGSLTLEDLNRRGWDLDTRVKEMKID